MNENDQSIKKQLKKAKEISDIISDRDEVQRLLCEGCWEELDKFLHKLIKKYLTETFVFNVANPNPPANLEENARNCINFLNTLLAAKAVDGLK